MNDLKQDRIEYFKDQIVAHNCQMIIADDVVNWLEDIGYFEAPASINHHLNYEGGLLTHSFHVAGQLCGMTDNMRLHWQRPQSPFVIGMLHDVCKCDDYIKTESGWQYKDKSKKMYGGHGIKSVLMLAGHVSLIDEEVACIVNHMGTYTTDTDEWNRYNLAVQKFPNVLWTHTADNYAAQVMEKDS